MADWQLITGNCIDELDKLPEKSVQLVLSSPPYLWARNYGHRDQIGHEPSVKDYVDTMVKVARACRRVLKYDGVMALVLGDKYNGSGGAGGDYSETGIHSGQPKFGRFYDPTLRRKCLCMIPARVAIALSEDQWVLRSEIIWAKPDPPPQNAKDRPTSAHESIYWFSKNETYYSNMDAIVEPLLYPDAKVDHFGGNNYEKYEAAGYTGRAYDASKLKGKRKRDVWLVSHSGSHSEEHHASYPPALIEPIVLALTRPGDTVLDPFSGTATTGVVATMNGRNYIGIDIKEEYNNIGRGRLENVRYQPEFGCLS